MECINENHEFIEDEFYVCKFCGLVQSDYVVTNYSKDEPETYYFSSDIKNEEERQKNTIADAIHFFHLSTGMVSELYNKITLDERKLTFSTKLAIYLYSHCIEIGTCIRFNDICLFCGVEPKSVLKHCTGKSHFQAEDICMKVCKILEMPMDEIKEVSKCISGMPENGHNPYTEVASCIYHLYKEKYSIHDVCNAAKINPISIKRFINKYLKK